MKVSPNNLLSALMAHLTALRFPDAVEGAVVPVALRGELLFEQVKAYDLDNLAMAFEELLLLKKRVAVVTLTDEAQDTSFDGRIITTRFTDDFAIFIADRSWKSRTLAMVGDADTAGVLLMSHIVATATLGEFTEGLVCEATGGEIFSLEDEEEREENTGRVGWRQQVRLHGGVERRSLSRSALKYYAPKA